MQELLTQLIPDMLNRAELGRIRWQPRRTDIGRRFERLATVSARTGNHHDDALPGLRYQTSFRSCESGPYAFISRMDI
jgi:hypothetical protein